MGSHFCVSLQLQIKRQPKPKYPSGHGEEQLTPKLPLQAVNLFDKSKGIKNLIKHCNYVYFFFITTDKEKNVQSYLQSLLHVYSRC